MRENFPVPLGISLFNPVRHSAPNPIPHYKSPGRRSPPDLGVDGLVTMRHKARESKIAAHDLPSSTLHSVAQWLSGSVAQWLSGSPRETPLKS